MAVVQALFHELRTQLTGVAERGRFHREWKPHALFIPFTWLGSTVPGHDEQRAALQPSTGGHVEVTTTKGTSIQLAHPTKQCVPQQTQM